MNGNERLFIFFKRAGPHMNGDILFTKRSDVNHERVGSPVETKTIRNQSLLNNRHEFFSSHISKLANQNPTKCKLIVKNEAQEGFDPHLDQSWGLVLQKEKQSAMATPYSQTTKIWKTNRKTEIELQSHMQTNLHNQNPRVKCHQAKNRKERK